MIGNEHGYEIVEPLTNFSNPNYYKSAFKEKYSKFTREDCINDEWQKVMLQTCGCFSPLLPLSRYVIDQTYLNDTSWCTDSIMLTEYTNGPTSFLKNKAKDFDTFQYQTKDGNFRSIAQDIKDTKRLRNMECLLNNTNRKDNLELVNLRCVSFCVQENYVTESNFINWQSKKTSDQNLKSYLVKEANRVKTILNQTKPWSHHELDHWFTLITNDKMTFVKVIYDLSKKSMITEYTTYPLIKLCSDIGGILGLWIGISVLVVAQVVVICRAIFWSQSSKNEDASHKEDNHKLLLTKAELITSFLSTSSFHGVNHLTGTESISNRIFWMLVLTFCFGGLVANLYKVIYLYKLKPITIEMKYKLDKDEYPFITICPSTLISFRYESSPLSKRLYKWNDNTDWTLNELINKGLHPIWTHLYDWQLRKQGNLSNHEVFLNSNLQFLREASIRHTLSRQITRFNLSALTRKDAFDLILSCEFSYQKCSFNNFTLTYHPVYKVCFTFRPSQSNQRLGYPEELSLIVLSNDINFLRLPNTSSISLFRGGVYDVHPYQTMPTMAMPFPFSQNTRQIVTIFKSVDKIIHSKLNPCSETHNDLITLIEDDVGFTGNIRESQYRYSTDLCEQMKVQEIVFKSCGCISPLLSLNKEQHKLFEQPHKCAELPADVFKTSITFFRKENQSFINIPEFNSSMLLQDYIMSTDGGKKFLNEFDCHTRVMTTDTVKSITVRECHTPCNKVTYDIKVNVNMAPSFYLSPSMSNIYRDYLGYLFSANIRKTSLLMYYVSRFYSTEYVFNYLSGFHFHFQTSEIKSISQMESYTSVEMLAEIGGVLGLWFGISLATLMELLEIIVKLIYYSS